MDRQEIWACQVTLEEKEQLVNPETPDDLPEVGATDVEGAPRPLWKSKLRT